MEIQINTDRHVIVDDRLRDLIRADVEGVLAQFVHSVTHVEVHLADESAGRTGGDHVRCLVLARPTGQDSVTVTAHAATTGAALVAAIDKLEALLRHKFDRLADKDQRDTIRGR